MLQLNKKQKIVTNRFITNQDSNTDIPLTFNAIFSEFKNGKNMIFTWHNNFKWNVPHKDILSIEKLM